MIQSLENGAALSHFVHMKYVYKIVYYFVMQIGSNYLPQRIENKMHIQCFKMTNNSKLQSLL